MKLYYSPNACSLAIHVLLEEINKPFQLHRVKFAEGEQHSPAYKAINPKSKVPLLERDDGTTLTELPAIAWYLARLNPELDLLPAGIEGETRSLELMDYLIATVHMRGFTRIFRPNYFSPNPEQDREALAETGRETIRAGFAIISPLLAGKDYLFDHFTIADAVLFFLEFWAIRRAGLALPENLAGHLTRMLARPAVQRALATEGL